VANGPNRDGLAVNRVVDAAAPGWRLLNCRPEMQKSVNLLGKERVLQTIEEGTSRRPTLRRTIDANASGPAVKATVGHHPGDKWTLIVMVDGKEVATKEVSAETCKEGWTDVVVDLSAFAGKSVLVELIGAGGDSSLWAAVTVGDR
jgi:hypothetical protein